MKKVTFLSLVAMALSAVSAHAISRQRLVDYARGLAGKTQAELKTAVYELTFPGNVLEYGGGKGKTWEGFYFTDRRKDGTVIDRYSDETFVFATDYLAVSGMNIEHSFPKSWWGGTAVEGYKDLYNLMPSEQKINGSKSNYGMGKVDKVATDNGCTKVGTGNDGVKLWEPADKWKGDFARGYMYMATAHQHLNGGYTGEALYSLERNEYPTLQKWAYTLYMDWARKDMVNQTEVDRNNRVCFIQGNRNLFVDFPFLCEYIWGDSVGVAFDPQTSITTCFDDERYDDYTEVDLTDMRRNFNDAFDGGDGPLLTKAAAPIFRPVGGTEDEPLVLSQGVKVTITGSTSTSTIRYRLNNGEWASEAYVMKENYSSAPTVKIDIDDLTKIEAFCEDEKCGENSDTIVYYYNTVGEVAHDGYLLYEDFQGLVGENTNTSGAGNAWGGNSNFPTVAAVYEAGNALKFGTGSKTGSITSKVLDFDGGTLYVTIEVKGWTNIEGKFVVSVTGSEQQTVAYKAKMADDFETVSLTFHDVAADPTVSIATSAKRAFLNLIAVQSDESLTVGGVRSPMAEETEYYNLAGQRVGKGYRGIVVTKGKKLIHGL